MLLHASLAKAPRGIFGRSYCQTEYMHWVTHIDAVGMLSIMLVGCKEAMVNMNTCTSLLQPSQQIFSSICISLLHISEQNSLYPSLQHLHLGLYT